MPDTYLRAELITKNVPFFHAMNLRGFSAYCANGNVMSRAQLMAADPLYTRFWSDPADQRLGVLDRVFGNVYEFGAIFPRAGGTPNIYGPISLKFRPDVYSVMPDLVATQQSIATGGGTWRTNAILSQADVDAMLAGDGYGSRIAKSHYYTEISTAASRVPLDYLDSVVVEPLMFQQTTLIAEVQKVVAQHSINVPVIARHYGQPANLANLQTIAAAMENHQPGAPRTHNRITIPNPPAWIAPPPPWIQPRMELWCTYFYNGTICFLRGY